ncbi:MAG: BglG family transcription antiterminator [Lachnospiraceae bacterium]|nr:BglG family transcription antiterminator [Lachnospiraceae bacterium]
MDFTPRLKQILLAMLRSDQVLPVKSLAEQIGVSKRTVQRELEYIGSSLKPYHLTFQSKTGIGVWLEGQEEDKTQLLRELEEDTQLDLTNPSVRRERLILEILKDKTLQKLYYYGELFGVSEATISADLEQIEPWFAAHGMKVVRRPGSGIHLEGSEKAYRQAIRDFINEHIDTSLIKTAYEDEGAAMLQKIRRKQGREFTNLLDDEILKQVVSCIQEMQNAQITNMTENSYVGLVLHVTIAVNRILKGEIIEGNYAFLEDLKKEPEYALALRVSERLQSRFAVPIPEIETAYICLHLKGAKKQSTDGDLPADAMEQEEQMTLLKDMLDAFDHSLTFALLQDEEFIHGLLAHLQPTLVRLLHGMKIQNPILEQIQTDYQDIYQKCQNVANVIAERTHCPVPDAEIGFLAIHFGAAMVRLEGRKLVQRKVDAGVVCASGIGISRLMMTKISNCFRDRVELKAYGKNDLSPYVLDKLDFLISSLPLEQVDADILYVNPLLPETDMKQIEEKIARYELTPAREKQEDPFTRQLEQVNYVAVQIKSLIENLVFQKVDEKIGFEELLVAVSEKLSPYADRRAMIQEDIMAREKLASQVFAEFGFALLHSRTGGVTKPCISICMTKSLNLFEDPYWKQIGVVIVMLLPREDHLEENSDILGYISSSLIEDPDFLVTIMEGDKEKMQDAMSRNLKQYFNQYLNKL